jgi:hypothetical protein
MQMPNITPAQIIAVVGAILAVAISAGLDISKDLQDSILQLTTVLSGLLLGADAVIRHGRSRALGVAPRPPVAHGETGDAAEADETEAPIAPGI